MLIKTKRTNHGKMLRKLRRIERKNTLESLKLACVTLKSENEAKLIYMNRKGR